MLLCMLPQILRCTLVQGHRIDGGCAFLCGQIGMGSNCVIGNQVKSLGVDLPVPPFPAPPQGRSAPSTWIRGTRSG